jgi:hypothetical protein
MLPILRQAWKGSIQYRPGTERPDRQVGQNRSNSLPSRSLLQERHVEVAADADAVA